MTIYYANHNLSPDQSDQWSMAFSSLPTPDYDSCLGWSMLGLSPATSEPVPGPQNAQLEFADLSSSEAYSLDITKDYWGPSTHSYGLGTSGYHTPMPIGSPARPMYPEHQQTGVNEPGRPTTVPHTGIQTPQRRIRKLSYKLGSPKSLPDHSSPPPIMPKPMPRRRSSQDSTTSQHRRSVSSDSKDDDPNICMLRKKAHNQVEKRYRANLNAGFKQLEDVTKQDCATSATDTKMAKGLRPGRKALILQHAYEHIVGLQAELRSLQMRLGEK
ncbi:hypothetical protein BDV23DRAFT_157260 [Aspergillus alliaceus]|uniref:BHLH domain-containing protein n=1 Tax=Petromyces alliaceus TaxID=209559 RepID=A0A5N7C6U2_PETAA|nr:hypothetical protein BDV23DRAFT_157260 [Aspergillus alliaceus]